MKRRIIAISVIAGVLCVIGILLFGVWQYFKVKTVYVEGNVHYTNEEITQMVTEGTFGSNSLYLALKYRKGKKLEDIPFIQTMNVDILSPNTIRITVYEKALAGYISHLGHYMYFDKDGVVVEVSDQRTSNIPQVTGLKFGHVIMYERLPVENPNIFNDILDITQLLKKYEIRADKIYFGDNQTKTLYFGETRVSLGTNDNIGEKIQKLKGILPQLEGKKGQLRMDNYSNEVKNITFELD